MFEGSLPLPAGINHSRPHVHLLGGALVAVLAFICWGGPLWPAAFCLLRGWFTLRLGQLIKRRTPWMVTDCMGVSWPHRVATFGEAADVPVKAQQTTGGGGTGHHGGHRVT